MWWKGISAAPSSSKENVDFLVIKGRSASQIGESLYGKGLIKSPLAFKFYVQATGKSDQIQAGEFQLSPSYSLKEVVNTLTSAPLELWVTIPEGLRREEMVSRFIESLKLNSNDAFRFREEFLSATGEDEGYLFPDTYLFPRDISASAVVEKMKSTFDQKVNTELSDEFSRNDRSLEEIIILASILERETKTDEERPIVAGILWKRLDAGWPLQADATVQYAVGGESCQKKVDCNWWPILSREDLEIISPYNSYKFTGLPPTPISNPGFSSLKGAVLPKESKYWYYIHDSDGKIHYAETLEGHNANIRKYLGK